MIKALVVDAWHSGLRSPKQIDRMLAFATECGFTDIYLQVRRAGDAFYNSELAAKSETVYREDFDPLAYAIEHKGSLKIHAYLTMLQYKTEGAKSERGSAHPDEWLMKHPGGCYWFDPIVTQVRAHMKDIVKEVVTNYRVDGIFLEKLRYPGRHTGSGSMAEREEAIKSLIEEVSRETRTLKPEIKITLCVHGNGTSYAHNVSRDLVDWRELHARRVIDYAAVMVFKHSERSQEFDQWIQKLNPEFEILMIGGCMLPMEESYSRKSKLSSFHTAFYSYANFSSDKQDTRESFKAVVCRQ